MASPPVLGLALSRSLGFIVIGRLAQRFGITVRMMSSPAGGASALVTVPATLVQAAEGSMLRTDSLGATQWGDDSTTAVTTPSWNTTVADDRPLAVRRADRAHHPAVTERSPAALRADGAAHSGTGRPRAGTATARERACPCDTADAGAGRATDRRPRRRNRPPQPPAAQPPAAPPPAPPATAARRCRPPHRCRSAAASTTH